MLLEDLGRPVGIDLLLIVGHTLVEQRIDFRAPILGIQQLRPTHLPSDDFVAVGIIKVCLQQLHVLFGLAVLLLKEALPLILIPDTFGLTLVLSHTGLNASFAVCAKFFAPALPPRQKISRTQLIASEIDRKSTRLNSSHDQISYAV